MKIYSGDAEIELLITPHPGVIVGTVVNLAEISLITTILLFGPPTIDFNAQTVTIPSEGYATSYLLYASPTPVHCSVMVIYYNNNEVRLVQQECELSPASRTQWTEYATYVPILPQLVAIPLTIAPNKLHEIAKKLETSFISCRGHPDPGISWFYSQKGIFAELNHHHANIYCAAQNRARIEEIMDHLLPEGTHAHLLIQLGMQVVNVNDMIKLEYHPPEIFTELIKLNQFLAQLGYPLVSLDDRWFTNKPNFNDLTPAEQDAIKQLLHKIEMQILHS